jgi:hypothetical protein
MPLLSSLNSNQGGLGHIHLLLLLLLLVPQTIQSCTYSPAAAAAPGQGLSLHSVLQQANLPLPR